MNFNCEVVNYNTKTKKEGDGKHTVTVVTLETFEIDHSIVKLVNQNVEVVLNGIYFFADLTDVTVSIKKVNKIPARHFKIKLEFAGVKDEISYLVNKSVEASIE